MVTRNLNILLIDDEPDFAQPIADYLAHQYQHTVKHVQSVELAQKEVGKKTYDVIFLDYRLPGASGIEFLKWAKANNCDTPVVVVTGKGAEEVAVQAMKLGAYDYLNKGSIQLDYLPVVINNAYERYVLRKANRELEQEKLNRDRQELAIKVFQETVKAFVHRINNDLANILLRIKLFEKQRAKQKSAPDQNLKHLLGELEFSAKAIEATVSALVGLNQTVTKLHDVEKKAVDLKAELERTLKELQDRPAGGSTT